VAMDGGTFSYDQYGADLDSLWIVRRGWGLDLHDRADIGASGTVVDSVQLPGDPRDVWVGDCASGAKVLVAAGLDDGVLEVDTSDGGADGWPVSWVADLGDVRAFAWATEPFLGGTPVPETCADLQGAREYRPVPAGCTAKLYALSEAGVLPVPVDVCSCP